MGMYICRSTTRTTKPTNNTGANGDHMSHHDARMKLSGAQQGVLVALFHEWPNKSFCRPDQNHTIGGWATSWRASSCPSHSNAALSQDQHETAKRHYTEEQSHDSATCRLHTSVHKRVPPPPAPPTLTTHKQHTRHKTNPGILHTARPH